MVQPLVNTVPCLRPPEPQSSAWAILAPDLRNRPLQGFTTVAFFCMAIGKAAVTDPRFPSWRKGAAIAAILLLVLLWAGFVASFAGIIGRWPVLVQALFYLVVGLAWIAPLKPLIRWTETGKWRSPAGRD